MLLKSRKKEVDELNKRVINQVALLLKYEAVLLEVRRRLENSKLNNSGPEPFSAGYRAAMDHIENALISLKVERVGRSRQSSIAIRPDPNIGRRLATDEVAQETN